MDAAEAIRALSCARGAARRADSQALGVDGLTPAAWVLGARNPGYREPTLTSARVQGLWRGDDGQELECVSDGGEVPFLVRATHQGVKDIVSDPWVGRGAARVRLDGAEAPVDADSMRGSGTSRVSAPNPTRKRAPRPPRRCPRRSFHRWRAVPQLTGPRRSNRSRSGPGRRLAASPTRSPAVLPLTGHSVCRG